MLGIWVNFAAVAVGGLIGCLLRGGIPKAMGKTINAGLALCVMVIGLQGAIATDNMIIVILSIVIGTVIGERIGIEKGINRLGDWAQARFAKGDSSFSAGFVNASLLFCIGAMAVVGSLEAGLQNKPDTLLAKSAIDGVSSVIFASTLGPGVIFSAIPLTIYQGGIALLSGVIAPLMTDALIRELSAVGSVMIIGIGLNMLEVLPERIRVGNMLPGLLVPCVWFPAAQLLEKLF